MLSGILFLCGQAYISIVILGFILLTLTPSNYNLAASIGLAPLLGNEPCH